MVDGDEPVSVCAGYRAVEVNDAVQGASLSVRFLYRARARARPEPFGPFTLRLAMNAPIEGSGLPLVVVSHGTGGTPWTHRDLAAHLARRKEHSRTSRCPS